MENRAGSILALILVFFTGFMSKTRAQCPSGNASQTITLPCGVSCANLSFNIADLRNTSDYLAIDHDYLPFPYQDSRAVGITFATPPQWPGNSYSAVKTLPFSFCFYDSVITKFVVGSNGCISFDTTNALKWCESRIWVQNAAKRLPLAWFAKALVAGVLQDLDLPDTSRSHTGQKIEYRIEGTAPCRRAVISFYKVPLWPGTLPPFDCYTRLQTTQIVLHEGSGIIDVFEKDKPPCPGSNDGRGIIGIQDWTQSNSATPRLRNGDQWGGLDINESYRFLPHGGAPKFIRAELWEGPHILATSTDTTRTSASALHLQFDNVCPAASTTFMLMKSVYSSCDDAGQVIMVDTVFINRSTILSATYETIAASCGGSNGSIIVHVAPGAGTQPYSYILNGGLPQRDSVFSGLAAGSYIVIVRDAGGCSNSFTVNLRNTGILITSVTVTPPSCSAAVDGTITINVLNGTAPFQYTLNGGPPQSAYIFTGLAPGTYTVQAFDITSCRSVPEDIVVPQGPPLAATIQTTPTSCSGATNGTITVTPTNGRPAYQYSLDAGPQQSSNTFNNLAVGNYTVHVVEASGCTLDTLVTIQPGQPLSPAAAKTDVSCNGGNDGVITVSVSNGSAPYQYSIDGVNFQAGNIFNNLAAGSYTITVRDNNGCSGTVNVVIGQPAALSLNPTVTPVRCNGETNGSISVAGSGGTTPYQYSLDGINYQSGNVFSGLAAAIFTVYIKDSKGCQKNQQVTVNQPQPLQLNITTQNASCGGGNDGQIIITPSGGNGSFQFSIDAVNYQGSNIFSVAPGTYSIAVKDVKGCSISQSNIVVGLSNTLRVSAITDTTICLGKSVNLNAVSNAAQYNWSPSAGLSSSTIANPTATLTAPGLYTYIVDAVLGPCNGSDTVRINVLPAPFANAGGDVRICRGDSIQLSGSGGLNYQWTPATALSNAGIPGPFARPTITTIYNLLVTDANGCTSLTADDVRVDVIQPFNVNITPDNYVTPGDIIQLHAEGGVNYNWSPPTGLNNPNISDPLATISADIVYKVVVTTAEGCKSEDSVSIKAFKGPDIYVPTAFSPNFDGVNDQFMPIPVGIKEYKYFRVYDRWGALIFSTDKLRKGWDGKYKGYDLATGVYVWVISGVTDTGKLITKKGTVTLIR
jgi:gliding motility-associated-like protein